MKFSMFAAVAALIAVSGLAHAGGQGPDGNAFFPGGRGAPYPTRSHAGEIVNCVIDGILPQTPYHPGQATLHFINSHGEDEIQVIGNGTSSAYLEGVRANLISGPDRVCPDVEIKWPLVSPGVAGVPAPGIAGPADIGPGGPGFGGPEYGGW